MTWHIDMREVGMNIENQSYRILVSTQQEAEEIQKLFFACGYKWAWQRYAEQREVRLGFFIKTFHKSRSLVETTCTDHQEITLPELREFFQKSPWGQIESLKARLAEVKSTNHSLEEINADLSESLKLLKDKYQSDDYVLVPKKELTIWYFNEAEGMWLEEADNFLCEVEAGQVFTVQRQHNFSLPEVYVARPWSEEEQWSDHYKEYSTKEEAEQVALHCKAMIEAQGKADDTI